MDPNNLPRTCSGFSWRVSDCEDLVGLLKGYDVSDLFSLD